MNILDTIIQQKRLEVTQKRMKVPIQELQHYALFSRMPLSLCQALLREGSTGIIAEFKRQSPSRGVINARANVVDTTAAYEAGGAAALSILTDHHFFGGSNDDIFHSRVSNIPILRKDFIVDEYQVVEARAIGADAILLIAACLTPAEVKRISEFAKSLQLEVLLEVHDESELGHICPSCDLVGVNNRDLKSFAVDVNRSVELSEKIPGGKIKISESGIADTDTIHRLRASGFDGFLIGENFMKQDDPGAAFVSFINKLKMPLPQAKG